jgi:hypothetical protein
MTETILAMLSRVRDLKVISRTSVMRFKGTTKSVHEIASELGVAHLDVRPGPGGHLRHSERCGGADRGVATSGTDAGGEGATGGSSDGQR